MPSFFKTVTINKLYTGLIYKSKDVCTVHNLITIRTNRITIGEYQRK